MDGATGTVETLGSESQQSVMGSHLWFRCRVSTTVRIMHCAEVLMMFVLFRFGETGMLRGWKCFPCRFNRVHTLAIYFVFNTVLGVPSITPFSFPDRPLVGSQIKVMCFAGGGGSLLWLKDGVALHNGAHDVNLQNFNGFLVLSIDSVQPEHTGNYTCAARNGGSESHFSAFLEVSAPPRWTSVPEEIVVAKSSDRLSLTCEASGYPKPTITWFRGNGQFESNRKKFQRFHPYVGVFFALR